jgi:3D (Asp-Asp-Asp) domain-containing protein
MRANRQARIHLFPALYGLFSLLIARVPDRSWGFLGLLILLPLVVSSLTLGESLQESISRFDGLKLPTIIQTRESEGSKKVTQEEILEAQSLVKTPTGTLPFERKLRVFATSYDKNCPGCNEVTATGMRAGNGVIAVDPKVIPLGSRVYIPGYGIGVAGDTGGAIKGNKIDLGFDDIKTGWWRSRFVEIYVLR